VAAAARPGWWRWRRQPLRADDVRHDGRRRSPGAGGPPGWAAAVPGGAGGRGEERGDQAGNEELVREVRQLRDEVRDATRQLQRIAQALEDD